jgi:long-chain acyl-CoA synthetase
MTGQNGPEPSYLAELGRTADRNPGRVAVADGDLRFTFAELMILVRRRAKTLALAGLKPGDRVALVAENSAYYLVSAFAVWLAGGVLATIYPSTAQSDLAYTLQDSDPALLLADSHTIGAVSSVLGRGVPISLIDDAFAVDRVRRSVLADPSGLRASLHMICYSSGTTSRPKAIMLSAGALFNGARTYAEVWRMRPSDKTIVCLPMAWLYGLNTTSMATLLTGGTVISLRRGRPELIIDAIERHGATVFAGVTTMFAKIVDYLSSTPRSPDLSSLRLCVSGGEPRNEAAFGKFTALTGRPVHDTFCASECFPLITYDPAVDPAPVPGAAGKVVPRSRLKVVGPDGTEVAPGCAGEALSQGPGLMLGYWRDPEQTAAAMTADGWYRTRDLVRIDDAGYIHVVGRLSDMIIRGGSNVSPAEVERVLREHPSVRDASVVGLPDETYGQKVFAAVVLNDSHPLDETALHEFASAHLAAYKLPSGYVAVPQLPQNPTTGKVDRRQVAAAVIQSGGA